MGIACADHAPCTNAAHGAIGVFSAVRRGAAVIVVVVVAVFVVVDIV